MIRDAVVACTRDSGDWLGDWVMVALPFSKEGSLGQGDPHATSEWRVW